MQHDVNDGRQHLNFSDWDTTLTYWEGYDLSGDLAEVIQEGEMPMPIYLPAHPEARLTPAEKSALITGLQATVGNSQAK